MEAGVTVEAPPEEVTGAAEAAAVTEALPSSELQKPPNAYMVRVLTGQFDSGIPFDTAKGGERLAENNPKEAYEIMHKKWGEVRDQKWQADSRTHDEQVKGWAKGRAKVLSQALKSGGSSSELREGLSVMGLTVGDPANADQTQLENYFATKFYSEYAGTKDKSVANLAEAFFARCQTEGKVDQAKADTAMGQLRALEAVLGPILTAETYKKLLHTMESRIAGGQGKLKPEDGAQTLDEEWKKELEYFAPQTEETAQPNPTISGAAHTDAAGAPAPTPDAPAPGGEDVKGYKDLMSSIEGSVPTDAEYNVPDNVGIKSIADWQADQKLMMAMVVGKPAPFFPVSVDKSTRMLTFSPVKAAPYADLDQKYDRYRSAEEKVPGSGIVGLAAISNTNPEVQSKVLANEVNALIAAYRNGNIPRLFEAFLQNQTLIQLKSGKVSSWSLYGVYEFDKAAAKSQGLPFKDHKDFVEKLTKAKKGEERTKLSGSATSMLDKSGDLSDPQNADMLFAVSYDPDNPDFPVKFDVGKTAQAMDRRVTEMEKAIASGTPLTVQQLRYAEFLSNAFNVMPVIRSMQGKSPLEAPQKGSDDQTSQAEGGLIGRLRGLKMTLRNLSLRSRTHPTRRT